jgi:hypothetical protein
VLTEQIRDLLDQTDESSVSWSLPTSWHDSDDKIYRCYTRIDHDGIRRV